MSSLFSKALVYLGLVDEDQVDEEPMESASIGRGSNDSGSIQSNGIDTIPEGRRVEPPPTSRAATRPQARSSAALPASLGVRPVEIQSDILIVEEFADARMLADRIRERTPVVLDMRTTDRALIRRVIDFSSGLIYAMEGSMRKVGDGLVAVLPPRVTLSRDEKRRLTSLGAYELQDIE